MLDFDEIFSKECVINVQINGAVLAHHLAEPSDEIDLAYRRRLSTIDRNGQPTDVSLNASLWLYNQITQKVIAKDSDGSEQEVPNFQEKIANDMKLAVIGSWLGRFEVKNR